jgi:hypothetical protein
MTTRLSQSVHLPFLLLSSLTTALRTRTARLAERAPRFCTIRSQGAFPHLPHPSTLRSRQTFTSIASSPSPAPGPYPNALRARCCMAIRPRPQIHSPACPCVNTSRCNPHAHAPPRRRSVASNQGVLKCNTYPLTNDNDCACISTYYMRANRSRSRT